MPCLSVHEYPLEYGSWSYTGCSKGDMVVYKDYNGKEWVDKIVFGYPEDAVHLEYLGKVQIKRCFILAWVNSDGTLRNPHPRIEYYSEQYVFQKLSNTYHQANKVYKKPPHQNALQF